MRYGTRIVRLENPQDLKGRGDDSDKAIITSKKEILRSRADTADFVVFEEGLALVVRWVDLADFEEIECLPLQHLVDAPMGVLAQ